MLDTLRRFLWSVPMFGALTVGLFALLTSLDTTQPRLQAPRFFNRSPVSAQSAAREAMTGTLRGNLEARARLVVLGGAALPTILASWPARPLPERRLIAEALWPVAERMGFSNENIWMQRTVEHVNNEEKLGADQQLLFWERYRDEQATDLNPLAVQRLVKRLASHDAQLRRRELQALDTFALPALVSALGRVTETADVARCRRLVRYIAHATGQPFQIEEGASVVEAQREVTKVRRFWDELGSQWTQHTAMERLVGRVVQTEYSRWLMRTIREITRLDRDRDTEQLLSYLPSSIQLLLACLLGLVVLGPLLSSAIVVTLLGTRAYRIERAGLRLVLTAALVLASMWTLRPPMGSFRLLLAIAVFCGAAFGTFIFQRELSDRLDWRTHHLLRRRGRVTRIFAIGRWIAPTIPTLLPMALLESFVWVTCLELTSGRQGVGSLLRSAYLAGDWVPMMKVSLGLGILTLGLQLLSDSAWGREAGKVES